MGMRSFRLGTVAMIVAIVLSACVATEQTGAQTTPGAQTSPGAQTKVREDFRVAIASLGTESFDPIVSPANNAYIFLIFDALVGVNADQTDLSKETGIAKDWKASDDSKTFTFFLREGVKFHNGDEVTAEDVKYTLERLKGPVTPTNALGPTVAKLLDTVTVKGKYEVEVKLKQSSPLFILWMSNYTNPVGLVVPKKYIEAVGQQAFNQKPIGTGPYKFVERQTGAFVKLEQAFPEHFIVGKPRFKRVTFNLVPEESTRIAMLKSGDADFVDVGVDGAAALKKDGFRTWQHGAADSLQIWFQLQRPDEATRDINVRKALSYAINREEIIKNLLAGLGKVATTPFGGQIGAEEAQPYEYNLDKAKQSLAQTDYKPGGKKLSLTLQAQPRPGWPQMLTIAGALQTYWSKIGIDTAITYRDYGAFRAEWAAGKLPANSVQILNYPGARPEWTGFVGAILNCKGSLVSACDPVLDATFAKWISAPNEQEFQRVGREVEKYVRENFYSIGLIDLGVQFAGNDQIPTTYTPGRLQITWNERAAIWDRPAK